MTKFARKRSALILALYIRDAKTNAREMPSQALRPPRAPKC